MGKFRDKFKIRSSESIDRIDFDLNVGVVRVSGGVLRNFSRNEFVRIINHTAEGKPKIIRIIRARTGQGALSDNEIALQYDDRVKLNIRNAGDHVDLTLHTIPLIVAIWPFCASHSSPPYCRTVLAKRGACINRSAGWSSSGKSCVCRLLKACSLAFIEFKSYFNRN